MEPTIDCPELFAQLGDDEVLILDCRSDEDWELWELHIPGALRMGYSDLLEGAHTLPDDELIILCGSAPGEVDARKAYRLLRLRGRTALVLEGGLEGWVTHGYPTERHAPRRRAGGRAAVLDTLAAAKNG